LTTGDDGLQGAWKIEFEFEFEFEREGDCDGE
jgi:hypothetical protein